MPSGRVVWETPEPKDGESCVFVCNHAHTKGPFVMLGWFPRFCRPWMIDQMLSLKTMPAYLRTDFFHAHSKTGQLFYAALSALIAPPALFFIRRARPISAHRNKAAFATIQESVASLVAGEDNVIFPEREEPLDGTCGDFMQGFLHLAPAYLEVTGKELTFYPVAVCTVNRTIHVGKGRRFDLSRSFQDQKQLMASELREDIIRMIGETKQAPEHQPGHTFDRAA